MRLTATTSAAQMNLIVAQAEARSPFGACGSGSANSIEEKSLPTRVTERTGNVQDRSVHRFIAKNEFGRFWRNEFALFFGTATRRLNSETPRSMRFRRRESFVL